MEWKRVLGQGMWTDPLLLQSYADWLEENAHPNARGVRLIARLRLLPSPTQRTGRFNWVGSSPILEWAALPRGTDYPLLDALAALATRLAGIETQEDWMVLLESARRAGLDAWRETLVEYAATGYPGCPGGLVALAARGKMPLVSGGWPMKWAWREANPGWREEYYNLPDEVLLELGEWEFGSLDECLERTAAVAGF